MGIVVDTVVARVHESTGRRFRWDEWEACCDALGLSSVEIRGLQARGYLLGSTVVLQAGMTARQRAETAWEEIGHSLTVVGNFRFWRSRLPGYQGKLTVRRFEGYARGVRDQLPDWDGVEG